MSLRYNNLNRITQQEQNTQTYQEKMRGQRGRLPVQALGYVNSTKVILGLPETAGVHFLLRPHHYVLMVITQLRNGGPRANTSMEASFTGILERIIRDINIGKDNEIFSSH